MGRRGSAAGDSSTTVANKASRDASGRRAPALSRPASWFLTGVGVWTWAIWPNFLRNIAEDRRSWDGGPTRFFLVHLVLTVASLGIGTGVGIIGVQQLRRRPRSGS